MPACSVLAFRYAIARKASMMRGVCVCSGMAAGTLRVVHDGLTDHEPTIDLEQLVQELVYTRAPAW